MENRYASSRRSSSSHLDQIDSGWCPCGAARRSSKSLKPIQMPVGARRVMVGAIKIKSAQTIFVTAAFLCLAPLQGTAAPEQAQDPEVQLGKQTFDELKVRAE